MSAFDELITKLQREISGRRALDTATTVARFNRIIGSADYAAVANLLRDQLEAYGLDEITIESFPVDGQISYASRVFGPAWEPHRARLEVVAPERYVIADFDTTPMCLPSGCPATPSEGITAEVVDVGAGDRAEHYDDIDVAGKAVVATGLTTDVYNLAVNQFGAAYVMTNNAYDWSFVPEIKRTMVDLPDATHLARLYYDAAQERTAPAFSITYRHAERLRALLQTGHVTVQATVDAEIKPGELLDVSATIQGTDQADEEVWIEAHLCHPKPGACDNGSGVALAVEIFRSLAVLIRKGQLNRPRRTLRLLLVPEVSGTQAYMDRYQTRMAQVTASLNLDMVGASYAATGAYCRLIQTPWSRPSFLNHLGSYLLERVSHGSHSHIHAAPVRNWLYAVAPYDKGSDHDVTLNSIYAIPSVFFFYWPHRFYHTDHDTPEKLDPLEFERVGTVAGAMALVAAGMDTDTASLLLNLIYTEATREIELLAQGLGNAPPATRADRIWALGETEHGALRSVLAALSEAERRHLMVTASHLETSLADRVTKYTGAEDSQDNPADDRVPTRLEPWPLNFGAIQKNLINGDQRLQRLREDVSQFDDKAVQALNYADGSRSVGQIARLVSGELGPFSVTNAAGFFELLTEAGKVTM